MSVVVIGLNHRTMPLDLFERMTVGELVARCGEPLSRRRRNDALVRRPAPGIEQWRDQRREDWIYDFGDTRSLRLLRIVDGRVDAAEPVAR